jgi:hypothetical protein
VGLSGFVTEHFPQQLSLFDAPPPAPGDSQLQHTLDNLRERFGDQSIKRGSDLT